MDIVKAKTFSDALILGLVFVASFYLANTLNTTAYIIFQENFASKHHYSNWISNKIYS